MVNWTNVTDLGQLPAQANINTGGAFWTGILYFVWVIILLALLYWGWEAAFLVSSFLAFVIGLFLVYADLVNWVYILPFLAIDLMMFLYLVWRQPKIRQ